MKRDRDRERKKRETKRITHQDVSKATTDPGSLQLPHWRQSDPVWKTLTYFIPFCSCEPHSRLVLREHFTTTQVIPCRYSPGLVCEDFNSTSNFDSLIDSISTEHQEMCSECCPEYRAPNLEMKEAKNWVYL